MNPRGSGVLSALVRRLLWCRSMRCALVASTTAPVASALTGCLAEAPDFTQFEERRAAPVILHDRVDPPILDVLTLDPLDSRAFNVPFTSADCQREIDLFGAESRVCDGVQVFLYFGDADGNIENFVADFGSRAASNDPDEVREFSEDLQLRGGGRQGCQRLYLWMAHRSSWDGIELTDKSDADVISWLVFIPDPNDPELTAESCLGLRSGGSQ